NCSALYHSRATISSGIPSIVFSPVASSMVTVRSAVLSSRPVSVSSPFDPHAANIVSTKTLSISNHLCISATPHHVQLSVLKVPISYFKPIVQSFMYDVKSQFQSIDNDYHY